MNEFLVWDPEEGEVAEAGRSIRSSSAEWAAEHFVERGWEGEEHERIIHVMDEGGAVTRWSVVAVPSVDFRARSLD